MLRISHWLEPDQLPRLVQRFAEKLGAEQAIVLLADCEQVELRSLGPEPILVLDIDGSAAGLSFRQLQRFELAVGNWRALWVPLVDGAHRLGVLEVRSRAGGDVADAEAWVDFAAAVAKLVSGLGRCGDIVQISSRRQPLDLPTETQLSLLPPLTLVSPRVIVTGSFAPAYAIAGDVFDYAVNGDLLHAVVVDAMGHTLGASLVAAVTVAAVRNARRKGGRLEEQWAVAEVALSRQFEGDHYATALFAELDLSTGRLRLASAGHPVPLLVRGGRRLGPLQVEPTLPLGLYGAPPSVAEVALQPHDRLLLFTDGVPDARSADGEFFGEDRLVDHLEREARSGLPEPEIVRRLMRLVVEHQPGQMGDDATLVLVQWLQGH